ncbi:hypothetical protein [Halomonas ramblicola]
MVVTMEPGLYMIPMLRIEDDVLIGPDGPVNLTPEET